MKKILIIIIILICSISSCITDRVAHIKDPVITGIDVYEHRGIDSAITYLILKDNSYELYVDKQYSVIGYYHKKGNTLLLQPKFSYKFSELEQKFEYREVCDSVSRKTIKSLQIKGDYLLGTDGTEFVKTLKKGVLMSLKNYDRFNKSSLSICLYANKIDPAIMENNVLIIKNYPYCEYEEYKCGKKETKVNVGNWFLIGDTLVLQPQFYYTAGPQKFNITENSEPFDTLMANKYQIINEYALKWVQFYKYFRDSQGKLYILRPSYITQYNLSKRTNQTVFGKEINVK